MSEAGTGENAVARDVDYMRRALELASLAEAAGEVPVGALVVSADGRIVGEGWNQVTSSNDPTAHAEIIAIRHAALAVGAFSLANSTIYASCEPCPMCLAAIYWARLDRLVFASTRIEAAAIGFDDDMIYREIAKPPEARRLASAHLPLTEARSVFDDWLRNSNRIQY